MRQKRKVHFGFFTWKLLHFYFTPLEIEICQGASQFVITVYVRLGHRGFVCEWSFVEPKTTNELT